MTAEELIETFNETFGLGQWPKSYIVDAETYANCCQYIFNKLAEESLFSSISLYNVILFLGPHKGLVFKNVELILVNDK